MPQWMVWPVSIYRQRQEGKGDLGFQDWAHAQGQDQREPYPHQSFLGATTVRKQPYIPDSELHLAWLDGADAGTLRRIVRREFGGVAGVSRTSVDDNVDVFRTPAIGDYSVESYTDERANFFALTLEPLDLGSTQWNNSEDLDMAFWVCLGALSDGVSVSRWRVRVEVNAINAVFSYGVLAHLLSCVDWPGGFIAKDE